MLAGLSFVAAAIIAIYELVHSPSLQGVMFLLLAVGGALLWFNVRTGDSMGQDRMIRAEMRARWDRVLGENRRADFERMTVKQLVALRFASDAELPGLVAEVLAGTTTEQDAIKRKVRDWQADHLRV